MYKDKKPLWRKENKTSLQTKYYISTGRDHRHTRNTKAFKNSEAMKGKMTKGSYDRDWTPLFNYLLKAVGRKWDDVYSEIKPRVEPLPTHYNPIFSMVEKDTFMKDGLLYEIKSFFKESKVSSVARTGESSYYSMLFINDEGLLQKVSDINKGNALESCECHTHSFNGKPFKGKITIN